MELNFKLSFKAGLKNNLLIYAKFFNLSQHGQTINLKLTIYQVNLVIFYCFL